MLQSFIKDWTGFSLAECIRAPQDRHRWRKQVTVSDLLTCSNEDEFSELMTG